MHPQGFKPLVEALTSPLNIVLALVGVALVVDLLIGSPLMSRLVQLQLSLMKIDPSAGEIRIVTMFGTFTDPAVWTRFIERVLAAIFCAIPALSWLRGAFVSVAG
jgi:hypothetical protein